MTTKNKVEKKQLKKGEQAKKSVVARCIEKLKEKWDSVIIIFATFFALLIIIFAVPSIDANFSMAMIDEYEVNQIADKTIVAHHSVAPDELGGMQVRKGETIIKKGFAITEDQYEKLRLFSENTVYGGSSLLSPIIFIFMVLIQTTTILSRKILKQVLLRSEKIFLAVLFFINYTVAALVGVIEPFNTPFTLLIALPSAFSTMLVVVMLGRRPAVFFSLILSLGILGATNFVVVPALYVLFSSLFVVFFSEKLEKRMALIYLSISLGLFNVVLLFLLRLVFPNIDFNFFFCVVGVAFSGFVSGVLALGFLTPVELVMNTASDFRLLDLSDLNTPIMKHLLLTAPGTYNHSMLVATLAETACREIGANSLLARVGAYYHDIGKLEQPEYFVENQKDGNKHDEINPRLSASVIKSHVRKGVEKAHSLHLPQAVLDIIGEHHGNGLISYFYHEAKKLDDQTQTEEFSYTGSPPSTRESAVVMLADTVEAACRTLDRPSVSRLRKFIRQLVMAKYEQHQLDKSNLTFYEMDRIQDVFVNILAGYYHSRIEYPNQKQSDADDEVSDNNEGKTE